MLCVGSTLEKLLVEALVEAPVHKATFMNLTETLNSQQVKEWTMMVEKWESDPYHAPNPYKVTSESVLKIFTSNTSHC